MKPFHIAFSACLVLAPSSLAQTINWSQADSEAVIQAVSSDAYGTVTSVQIRHHGEVLIDEYFNGADQTTLHDTRSATKTLSGMAIGAAIADGVIQLDDSVARYFSDLEPFENADDRKYQISFEDLLTMSGPLECDDWNQMSRGNEERMYLVEDWHAFFWNLPMRGYPSWATPPERAEYGRAFSYCTAGVQIAADAVGNALDQSFTDYVEARLFSPLGIETFEWPLNGLGQAHLGGGLRLTTDGLARFAELQLNLGRQEQIQVLPESWMRESVQPRAVIEQAPDGWRYGYLWWLIPYQVEGQTFYAQAMNGNGGNRVVVLPEFDLTYVFTNTDYNTPDMHRNSAAFFETEIVSRLRLVD